jgi:hypothetical protein
MFNILKMCGFLAVLILFISPIGTLAMAAETPVPKESPVLEVQIKDVVSNPGEYNGKKVALEGKVAKVDYRNSTKGEPFTIFKLKDSENNEVGVYFEDERLPISKGDRVKIMGRFWKEKSYFLYKIKNVIKARTVDII